ncbi:MAG: uroporphyrinogen decarboxylase family protein [Anaerolineae bacterium]|jgi:hypothetical protein|nr:uroporphyrinogen decarboxylase family protein [Anaerolineae bacterium]
MQTSYEVVRRAIEFNTPDRLPVNIPALGMSDFHHVGWNQIGTGDNSKHHTIDEWGCTWERTEVKNMGQVKGHPLSDWDILSSFQWPDPDNPDFYTGMEERFAGSEDKFIMTGIFMLLFERMHALHGFTNTLQDLYLERPKMEMLADRIVEYDLAIMHNIASRFPGRIHGFNFSDDWGTQQRTFVNPKFWQEFFAPRYQRIFDAAHGYGWKVWMHSCGKVNGIIGHLIDIGCDCINLQQPRALGIEEVGRQYAGKICFVSLCDIQHTLPFKGKAAIEEEANLLMQCWGTDKGGFILDDYGDGVAIAASREKKQLMLDAFLKFDRWRNVEP